MAAVPAIVATPTGAAGLTPLEADRLRELETIVDKGIQTFVEVGLALAEIRDSKLYRAEHGTFGKYLAARWSMSRSYGYRLIKAASVAEMSPMGDIPTERAARAKVKPAKRTAVVVEEEEQVQPPPPDPRRSGGPAAVETTVYSNIVTAFEEVADVAELLVAEIADPKIKPFITHDVFVRMVTALKRLKGARERLGS